MRRMTVAARMFGSAAAEAWSDSAGMRSSMHAEWKNSAASGS